MKLLSEGAEWSIFNDADAWKAVKYLGMEYHLIDGHTQEEVASTITKLGFKVLKQTIDGPTWGLLWGTR